MTNEELIKHLRQLGKYSEFKPNYFLLSADRIEELNGRVEVKHGYWKNNCNGIFTCSVCGGKSSKMNFCGNCGAKMNNEFAKCNSCKHWIYFADEKRCLCIINHLYSDRDYFCGRWESKVTDNG